MVRITMNAAPLGATQTSLARSGVNNNRCMAFPFTFDSNSFAVNHGVSNYSELDNKQAK